MLAPSEWIILLFDLWAILGQFAEFVVRRLDLRVNFLNKGRVLLQQKHLFLQRYVPQVSLVVEVLHARLLALLVACRHFQLLEHFMWLFDLVACWRFAATKHAQVLNFFLSDFSLNFSFHRFHLLRGKWLVLVTVKEILNVEVVFLCCFPYFPCESF